MNMFLRTAGVAVVALGARTSFAQLTFDWIGDGIAALDVSADGNVIVGNVIFDNSYETFRWTQSTGWVRLGRATVPVIGTGAGTPNVSNGGTQVSATILDQTELFQTMGRWEEGQDWSILIPPTGPGGTTCDNGIASTWGLSGDGSTVVGFYWASCKAIPCKYTTNDGLIPLPVNPGQNARVNGSNLDGSVVCGWESTTTGTWVPTAWRGLTKINLVETEYFSEAMAVSDDGSVIVGEHENPAAFHRLDGAVWTWNGSSYDTQYIDALPGTAIGSTGRVVATDVSGDGTIVVGTNYFVWAGPFSTSTGFIWTESGGTIDIEDVLIDAGMPLPPNFQISSLTAISQNASTIVGIAQDTTTGGIRSFRITFPPAGCDGDADGNESVDVNDISYVVFRLGNSGSPCLEGDVDGNGSVNVNDISYVVFRLGTCAPPTNCP